MTNHPTLPSKGETTRQAILEAAYSLFLEFGFHGTSMRQIAQRANLAVGGIYNHFASKDAIFDALIVEKHPYRQVIPILQSTPGDSVEAFAQNAAHTMLTELNRRPDFLKLFFIEIIEFNGRHIPLLAETVYPQVAPLLERFSVTDDRLRDIPLPVIFRSFIGMIFAYYLIQYMAGAARIPGIALQLDARQYIDIFLNGIIKHPESV